MPNTSNIFIGFFHLYLLFTLQEPQTLETTDSEADTPKSKSGETPIAGTPQKESKKMSRSKERKPRTTPKTEDYAVKPTPKAEVFKAPLTIPSVPSTMAPCRSTRLLSFFHH